jgi:hypothetical protein
MGIIVTALGGIFTFLTNFFLQYFTKRVAVGLSAVTLFMGFTVYFIGVMQALIIGIQATMPQPIIVALSWFFPSNFPACIAAIFAAMAARWVYDLKTKTMQFTLFQL